MTTSIVECKRCRFRFNYAFIPGASVSAVRLGTSRYMRCPKCNRFGVFNLADMGSDPKLPTYSDARLTARTLPLILGPLAAWLVVSLVWLRHAFAGPAAGLMIVLPGAAVVIAGVLALLYTARLQKTDAEGH